MENEDAVKFANRVKAEIARQGGLVDLVWYVQFCWRIIYSDWILQMPVIVGEIQLIFWKFTNFNLLLTVRLKFFDHDEALLVQGIS